MHGFIVLEFEKFIFTKYGFPAWERTLRQAGLEYQQYSALSSYPDEQMFALVHGAVQETGEEPECLLRGFGAFLVPNLLRVYRAYIDPAWKTMDLLEHAESNMHTAVRGHDKIATPPILGITRVSPTKLIIDYRSPRRLSALAVGIVEGVASYYGEQDLVQIDLAPDETGQTSRITVWHLSAPR